eukprot:Lankesteria_metandrocarpae@DN4342_c1_g1_i1.p1
MKNHLGERKFDVVLNCLIGDFIPNSLKLLRNGGTFIELGKREIWSQQKMQEERPDVRYEIVAIDEQIENAPVWFGQMLERIKDSIEVYKRTPRVFEMSEKQDSGTSGGVAAFRFLQKAQHLGKVVIKISSALESRLNSDGLCTDMEKEKQTYVITGATGGLGPIIASWLVDEGAKNVVMLSRNGTTADNASSVYLRTLKAVRVHY